MRSGTRTTIAIRLLHPHSAGIGAGGGGVGEVDSVVRLRKVEGSLSARGWCRIGKLGNSSV